MKFDDNKRYYLPLYRLLSCCRYWDRLHEIIYNSLKSFYNKMVEWKYNEKIQKATVGNRETGGIVATWKKLFGQ